MGDAPRPRHLRAASPATPGPYSYTLYDERVPVRSTYHVSILSLFPSREHPGAPEISAMRREAAGAEPRRPGTVSICSVLVRSTTRAGRPVPSESFQTPTLWALWLLWGCSRACWGVLPVLRLRHHAASQHWRSRSCSRSQTAGTAARCELSKHPPTSRKSVRRAMPLQLLDVRAERLRHELVAALQCFWTIPGGAIAITHA